MKTYQVVLTKTYAVKIKTHSKQQARDIAEFYTGDIKDISTAQDRRKYKFSIREIDCRMNESFEANKV